MIRKPEAKAQAELIINELAGHGFTFQRGHALNLVAKLQGYRGWNEFQAAAKTAENAARVAAPVQPAVPEVSYSSVIAGYFKDEIILRRGEVDIDDRLLVAYLQHPRWDSSTELLSTTIAGETYTLRICGQVRFSVRDPLTGDKSEVRSANGLTDEYIQALEAAENLSVDFEDHPFFEWIISSGDPVGGAFDRISTNPHMEIAQLKREFISS